MSADSDNSLENIDFGGRFARQFSDAVNWNQFSSDPSCLQLVLNPTSSTPAASDNSICDSGYDSFHVPTSCSAATSVANLSAGQHNLTPPILTSSAASSSSTNSSNLTNNINNNTNINCSINANNDNIDNNANNQTINTSSGSGSCNTSSSNNHQLQKNNSNNANNHGHQSMINISQNTSTTTTNNNNSNNSANDTSNVNISNDNKNSTNNTVNISSNHSSLISHQNHQNIITAGAQTNPLLSYAFVDRLRSRSHGSLVFNSRGLNQTQLGLNNNINHGNIPRDTGNSDLANSQTTLNQSTSPGLLSSVAGLRGACTQNTNTKLTSQAGTSHAPNPWATRDLCQRFFNVDAIEHAASLHRSAASYSEPHYTWSGQLPSRTYKNPVFSCKVFLGGVPWDVTEAGLTETFGRFGPLRVQWPATKDRQSSNSNNNNQHHSNANSGGSSHTKAGYVYLIYESERYVKALLKSCTQDFGSGTHPEKYYYQLSSRRMRFKEVQVIPWVLADSNYIRNQSGRPDIHRTVFVGALHGMLTAEGLAKIMNDLFGGVAYVGIDSDKHKYPIGSGRVTFNNQKSYLKAVSAAFVEVKSSQFCKKIQLDPYLESSECSTCHVQSGPIFCRDCLRYFCKTCWSWHHQNEMVHGRHQHHPLMRKKREN